MAGDEDLLELLPRPKLGETLRRLRELRSLTMGDVSDALRISVVTISNWELDRFPMTEGEQMSYLEVLYGEVPNDRTTELLEKNTELTFELRRVDRQRMVREFHTVVVGHTLPDYPAVPPEPTLRRQARLITEEYLEMMEAIYGHESATLAATQLAQIVDQAPLRVDFPALIDATVDLDYVVEGMRAWCGVDSQGAWTVVHAANMAKAGGPKRASDNKQLKPVGWQPPDLAAEIERQMVAAIARQRGPK